MKNQLNNSKTKMQYSFSQADRFANVKPYPPSYPDPFHPPNSTTSPTYGRPKEEAWVMGRRSVSRNRHSSLQLLEPTASKVPLIKIKIKESPWAKEETK